MSTGGRKQETLEHQRAIMSQQRCHAKQQHLIGAAGDPLAVSDAAGLIPALDLHYPGQYRFPRGAITLVSLILSLNKRELNGRFLQLLGLDSGEEETPAASFSARQG